MTKNDELSDEEIVERTRVEMQSLIERAVDAWEAGEDPYEAAGKPVDLRVVAAADLTELGQFDLDLAVWMNPATRRHWVYRHRDGTVYVLGLPKRTQLRQTGSARLIAFIHDPNSVN